MMAWMDQVIRAMTDDGAFRVIAAVTTETARGAMAAQGASGELALRLAELITGAVLVRETTAPGRRVQMVMRDRGGGTLVADSLPDGMNRGLVNLGNTEPGGRFGGDAVLQVNYTLPTGALHQGVVGVPAGADVSTALMTYMHESEQTVSMVVVEALGAGDHLHAAGGFLVQVLPEAEREAVEAMTTRLASLERITPILAGSPGRTAGSAETLLAAVLDGFSHSRLAAGDLRFGCTCSEERVLHSLASLPEADVTSMVDAGAPLEVRCDACGAVYMIATDALRAAAAGGGRA
jgi:molecular chaperone Hsp33